MNGQQVLSIQDDKCEDVRCHKTCANNVGVDIINIRRPLCIGVRWRDSFYFKKDVKYRMEIFDYYVSSVYYCQTFFTDTLRGLQRVFSGVSGAKGFATNILFTDTESSVFFVKYEKIRARCQGRYVTMMDGEANMDKTTGYPTRIFTLRNWRSILLGYGGVKLWERSKFEIYCGNEFNNNAEN
ncbi:hypothetical protein GQX74_009228 [Glossina fuscipes]|nr:hypothetical protein GQX74_009228 [Glossina fuscipes]